jgi:hypothetical protein
MHLVIVVPGHAVECTPRRLYTASGKECEFFPTALIFVPWIWAQKKAVKRKIDAAQISIMLLSTGNGFHVDSLAPTFKE